MYRGKITITGIPEKPEEPEEAKEEVKQEEETLLVTRELLDKFGFYMGKTDAEINEGIKKLNDTLKEFGITTNEQIAFFMEQVNIMVRRVIWEI